jgi:glycosyltransferase involved in cell wall biosynthesis
VRDFTDEVGMKENILDLLRDDALRNRVAEAGWKRVQKLTWENQCRRLAETYSRWLEAWDFEKGRFREGALQS